MSTCIVNWLKEFRLEFFLVFEAPQWIHGSEDVLVNELVCGNDVGLHDLHHWRFKFQLTFAACRDPGVSIDLLQLKQNISFESSMHLVY